MLDKTALTVDPTYQREIVPRTIDAVARDFSWPAFGVLIVFQGVSGTYNIVDGQNRHAGAMKRPDVTAVPCLIFRSRGAAEEAKTFLRINTSRQSVSAVRKHRASLQTQDPIAKAIQELVDFSGRKITETGHSCGTSFKCVRKLRSLYETRRTALIRIWPTICSVTQGEALPEPVLDGLVHLEHQFMQHGIDVSLADRRWADRLKEIGAKELHKVARQEAALVAHGGARIWAIGILKRLNKGLRKRIANPEIL